MKRCLYCFREYENAYTVCPYCGYAEGTPAAEPQYLQPGTLLASRYLVGAVIGAGGFGVTYGAWDRVLDQRVAVKEFLPGEFSTRIPGQTEVTIYGGEKTEQFRDGKNKFYEESRRLAKLQKVPGIVQIYNSFLENGTAYIVMEYLEGETLGARLKREGKLPLEEAIRIITPVLYSLEAVHREGILHRDIAPNNIFLTKEGQVKLLDFGAARSVTGTHSKSLTVLYKEGYTPEEQYRSHGEQGPWTDVYEAAATLYKMLTGITPPGALDRRRKDTLREPSKAGAKVPKAVDTALMNALNVEVRNRTQSAGQFLEELTGDKTVKSRYVRTEEKKAGQIPAGVKVGVGACLVGMSVFLVLLLTGVIGSDIVTFSHTELPEGQTRVPNVVNCDVEAAQKRTEDAQLSFMIMDKQFSGEIPENQILSQSIDPGSIIGEGAELQVVVSAGLNTMTAEELEEDGIELVEIPDMQYQDRDEAMSMLLEAGIEVEVEYDRTGIVGEGRVIEQTVEPGEKLVKGDRVLLIVEDFVVDWTDASVFEEAVREELGKPEGDIYASEMLGIEELSTIEIDPEFQEPYYGYVEDVREYDIDPLKNCLNLKSLELNTTQIAIDDNGESEPFVYITNIENLQNLKDITKIHIIGCRIDSYSWMKNMDQLEWLRMYYSEVLDISGVSTLTKLRKLKSLNLSITTWFQDISFLAEMEQLETLGISITNETQTEVLGELSQLKELQITGNAYKSNLTLQLSDIQGLQNLNSLYLQDIANTDVDELKNMPSLKKITVDYCDGLTLKDFIEFDQLDELYMIDDIDRSTEQGKDNLIDDLRALQQAQ